MKKIKEWFQGYSEKDVDTAIAKWGNGLLANKPFIEMTKQEMTAIRKRGVYLSCNNGTLTKHYLILKGCRTMTVSEIIKQLKEYPSNMPVVYAVEGLFITLKIEDIEVDSPNPRNKEKTLVFYVDI